LILALYLGLAWALMIAIAPVVYLARKAYGRLRRLPAG
jgi:hypothetical protein